MPSHAIYPSLRGKTVLISGGASGIGAATVELFALQGSKVIFLDISRENAEKTITRVTSLSETSTTIIPPIFYHCDLTDLPTLQSLTTEILSTHGPIHILINNAAATGSSARLDTSSITSESWDFNINANLRHIFFLSQSIIPTMKSLGGGCSIVNLGSITWRIPDGSTPVYGACKAAIMGLTRVQSKEFGKDAIRINSVMPGAIATERQRAEVLTEEYREEVFRNQSLKRDLEPVDVAKVVVFLASEEASGVTGSSYVVDGGWVGDV